YPDPPPLKPEERGIAADIQSNPDSGVSVGEDAEDHRDSGMVIIAPVGGIGAGQVMGENGGGGSGGLGNLDDGSGAAKEWKEKRWLGIKAKVIILGLGIGMMVLLSIGLGVGLGMGLRKSSSSNGPVTSISLFPTTEMPPSSEETGPPVSDPNNTFPDIKTGMAVLTPLILSEISSGCAVTPQDQSSPNFFNLGADLLWSCQNSPDKPLVWRFDPFPPKPSGVDMGTFPSHPDFLKGAEYGDGSWGGYMLSSLEGIIKFDDDGDMIIKDGNGQVEYSDGPGWRDGAQNPLFWHIPLAYYNTTVTPIINKRLRIRANNSSPVGKFANYKFGILYNKTVVLKQSAIDQTLAVLKNPEGTLKFADGTALGEGEIVWKCVWEKTLLDVEISINQPSLACLPKGFEGGSGPPGHGDDNCGWGDGRGDSGGFYDDRGALPTESPSGDPSGPPGGPPQSSFSAGNGDQFDPSVTALAIPTPTSLNSTAGSTDGYKFSDIPIAAKVKRGGPTLPYPLKITIEETRPTSKRLRRVMGMDLTDADPYGYDKLGEVKCTQMVVTRLGGLREFTDANGEGLVILKEQAPSRRKRDSTAGQCSCRWTS
ncbi:hypothetical protein L873DRAFT_1674913, partial [Choiromyces venosus 120613-1]